MSYNLDFAATEALFQLDEGDRLLVLTWGACGLSNRGVNNVLGAARIKTERRDQLMRAFRIVFPGRHGV